LLGRCRYYRRLPEPLRREFELQVQTFVADKTVTGVELEVDEELKLLVAASAATVSVGWEGFTWDQLTEVLVYPQAFDGDD